MAKGAQEKLTNKPRVHLVYEEKTHGVENIDLPLVALVLADLSGEREAELKPLKTREIEQVTSSAESIDELVAKVRPTVTVTVPDRLGGRGVNVRGVKLTMTDMDGFSPDRIVQEVPELREMMQLRQHLKYLLRKIDGNTPAQQTLAELVEAMPRKALGPGPSED